MIVKHAFFAALAVAAMIAVHSWPLTGSVLSRQAQFQTRTKGTAPTGIERTPLPAPTPPPRPRAARKAKAAPPGRLTGREFLLRAAPEATGYGLYSYVLLGGAPTTDSARQVYTSVMQEYLALPEITQFGVSKDQLNITLVPLTSPPAEENPTTVLTNYDYARAQELLAKVPGGAHVNGPYIVSYVAPLGGFKGILPNRYLYQDLSSVDPRLIVLWMHEFVAQSAQQDYWKQRDGAQIALRLRDAVATLAAGLDPAQKSVKDWQGVLANLLFWKPGS